MPRLCQSNEKERKVWSATRTEETPKMSVCVESVQAMHSSSSSPAGIVAVTEAQKYNKRGSPFRCKGFPLFFALKIKKRFKLKFSELESIKFSQRRARENNG